MEQNYDKIWIHVKSKHITSFFMFMIKGISKKSKVGDRSRGRPQGSLFDSYYTKV